MSSALIVPPVYILTEPLVCVNGQKTDERHSDGAYFAKSILFQTVIPAWTPGGPFLLDQQDQLNIGTNDNSNYDDVPNANEIIIQKEIVRVGRCEVAPLAWCDNTNPMISDCICENSRSSVFPMNWTSYSHWATIVLISGQCHAMPSACLQVLLNCPVINTIQVTDTLEVHSYPEVPKSQLKCNFDCFIFGTPKGTSNNPMRWYS